MRWMLVLINECEQILYMEIRWLKIFFIWHFVIKSLWNRVIFESLISTYTETDVKILHCLTY